MVCPESYVIETVSSQCCILKHAFKSQVTNTAKIKDLYERKSEWFIWVCENQSIQYFTVVP